MDKFKDNFKLNDLLVLGFVEFPSPSYMYTCELSTTFSVLVNLSTKKFWITCDYGEGIEYSSTRLYFNNWIELVYFINSFKKGE